MSKQVWLITGAGRGMGVDFAGAALAAGHSVMASGRDRERVSKVLGTSSDVLAVTLDVTCAADAEAAVRAAVDRFGRIDVLVNNAASFYAGYFEELTPAQIDRQLAASLIGPMNVTRAVLPVMRKQRSGHIVSISSSAGLAAGFEFVSAYAASKFGLEGWMESLQAEIAPFGIATTIVNPGLFRTGLLTEQSTNYAVRSPPRVSLPVSASHHQAPNELWPPEPNTSAPAAVKDRSRQSASGRVGRRRNVVSD